VFQKTGIFDFVIRCAGEGGENKKIITIDIPPVIVNLTTDRTLAAVNDSFKLTWTSQHARACSIDSQVGAVPLSGSQYVSFDTVGDKTVTFVCNGRGGTATSSVNIKAVSQQEYLDTLTKSTTGSNIFVQVGNSILSSLTAAANAISNVAQSVLDSITSVGTFFQPANNIVLNSTSTHQACPTFAPLLCPTGQHSVSGLIGLSGCESAPHCATDTSTLISAGTTTGTSSPFIQSNTQPTATLILSGGSNGSVLTESFIPADIVHVPFGAATNIQLDPTIRDGSSPGPKALNPGEPLQLEWNFASSSQCIVSNDADSEILPIPTVGSAIVHPSHTATYNISCQGGSVEPFLNSKTVFVKSVPGFTEIPPQ
ncbi:MAG: hypothetical protein AAB796_00925, partial [Patescibacteria group bacterium]